MTRYAARTEVDAGRSQAEIERTVRRYGADEFMYGYSGNQAVVGFRANKRVIRFVLPLPSIHDAEFARTPTGRTRSEPETGRLWEQAIRQRWRALALAIKAKLEAVEAGIAEFDDEFLAYIVAGDGRTVGDALRPQLDDISAGLKSPLLPMLESG